MGTVVARALEAITLSAGVEVVQDIQATPQVMADRDQLNSVVTNLVVNAGEAVGARGRIDVHLRHDNGRVVLSVTDTGCGMSPEFIRHSLFKPFQSTKKSGLGIVWPAGKLDPARGAELAAQIVKELANYARRGNA